MLIRRRIKFILSNRSGKTSNLQAIRMRLTLRGERPLDFALGYSVAPEQWDEEAEAVVGTGREIKEVNRLIQHYRTIMDDICTKFELVDKRIPTAQEVRQLFNEQTGRNTDTADSRAGEESLFDVFDLFIRQMGRQNQWTKATYQKMRQNKAHLYKYNPKVSFDTLSDETLQGFVGYYTKHGYRNTTIAKQMSFLRWFLRWACLKGYYKGNLHETFRPKIKGISVDSKEIIYLSQEELRQIQQAQLPPNKTYLERVRDVFLFQCFTGLRYSDVAKLRRSDIRRGVIHVVTQKTLDGLRIELNKHSQAMDKYADLPSDKALPVISNVKTNAYLKELGRIAGLNDPTRLVYFVGNERFEEVYHKWELLTTHVGRRTFVVTALQLGIPVEVIIRWTGHSNYEAMKPYVKIVDELKARSMSKFDML